MSEKSTRNDLDYVFESRAARNRSVFATANAALVAQNPSGGVQFQRIGAEKGDSSLCVFASLSHGCRSRACFPSR